MHDVGLNAASQQTVANRCALSLVPVKAARAKDPVLTRFSD